MRFTADDGSEFPRWEEKKLGEMAILRNGYAFSSSTYVPNGYYHIITIANVRGEHFITVDSNTSTIDELPKNIAHWQVLKENDILISLTGNVGRVSLNRGSNNLLNQRVGLLEVNSTELNVEYLYQRISSADFEQAMLNAGQGAAQQNISKYDIENFRVSIPSLPEQQKIASLLSSVDETVDLCQRKLDLLTQAKKALVQQIFSQKVRFTADDGSVFPDWEKRTLGDLFSISAGGDLDKEKSSSIKTALFPYPVYANARINNGLHGFANYYVISGNSFTVTGRGDVGYAVARHDKYVPIVRLLVCKPLHSENVDFFAELINQTHIFVESTGVPQLTVPQLSTLFVPVPSLPEQKKIAACLRSADALIDQARVELEQWQDVKKSLLQQLFV